MGGHSTTHGPLTGPRVRKSTLTGKAHCDGGDASGGLFPFKNGPYGQTALGKRPLRADRLTGKPLTGRLLTGRPFTKYRKAYGKLRGGTLPELGGNFPLCAVDQKRPFFLRVGPFLALLPFKGPFPLTGARRPPYGKAPYGEASYEKAPYELQESLRSYGKAPYELQESLREATGRDFTRIGREFPLVCRRPKKAVFS